MEKLLLVFVLILLGTTWYFWSETENLKQINQNFIDAVHMGTETLYIDGVKYERKD